jgi:hypothetical protein
MRFMRATRSAKLNHRRIANGAGLKVQSSAIRPAILCLRRNPASGQAKSQVIPQPSAAGHARRGLHEVTLTVIRARGRRLAKLICSDGTVESYDDAKHFDLFAILIADLSALDRLLRQLVHRPDCAVVRGTIADPARVRRVRRLAFPDNNTGDEPTLRDVPRWWLALDIEGVDRPGDVPAADLSRCAVEALRRLPRAFSDARCIVQATASHGIKPGCRLRLWYWLERPTAGAELTRWLYGTPADASVFRTVQPIYTAAPVFAPGASDHLPERIVMLPGANAVEVPSPDELMSPAPRPSAPMRRPGDIGAGRYAWAALRGAAARILNAGIGQRHRTILCEGRALARFVEAGLIGEGDVLGVLRAAGKAVGKPDAEIESVIAWSMAHPSTARLPKNVAR